MPRSFLSWIFSPFYNCCTYCADVYESDINKNVKQRDLWISERDSLWFEIEKKMTERWAISRKKSQLLTAPGTCVEVVMESYEFLILTEKIRIIDLQLDSFKAQKEKVVGYLNTP